MILARFIRNIQWFMKSNSSADGLSIRNMIPNHYSPILFFYVVKARFKNCIFLRDMRFEFLFVSFDNCSFYNGISMDALNNLFGSDYNITHVFLIRCTFKISSRFTPIDITVKDVESQIHIVQSRLIGKPFDLVMIKETSAVSPVAHLTIHDSIINDTSIKMRTPASTAVIVQITNTILTRTVVTLRYGYGQFLQTAIFIDNCTFIESSLHSPRSIIVYIVNSRFDVECQSKACALNLIGSGKLDMRISYLTSICDLYNIKTCYGIYLHNDKLIGHGIYTRSNSVVLFSADNLVINDSIMSGLQVCIHQQKRTIAGVVQVRTTILKHTLVNGAEYNPQGFVSYFIDNCTFIQSSLHSTRSIIVYIVNSRFDVECQTKGCALNLIGSGKLDMRISYLTSSCDLYNIKTCYGIYLHNNELIGHGIYARSNSVVLFSADNLVIKDSIMSGLQVCIHQQKRTFVGIVHIRNTILKHVVVKGDEHNSQGYTTYFIDNCTFIQSSLSSNKFRIMHIARSIFNANCQTKGCALNLTGPNHIDMDISQVNAMCELFQIKMCYGIYLSNIDFIGTESEAEFLTIEGNQTILENCTFSISTFVPICVTQNLIFEDYS